MANFLSGYKALMKCKCFQTKSVILRQMYLKPTLKFSVRIESFDRIHASKTTERCEVALLCVV